MAIRNTRRPPTVGQVYQAKYKGSLHHMTVVATKEGVGYRVSGKIFKTPTGAAKAITQHEINGWRFWNMDKS